ncbi:hypothetical protein ABZ816_26135 [Actinosynnema sp. NPDC047251]|uniref:PqqD family protein n=1 Tax=Saccharothrix espanaensis (strain ATCC 51144 / DSM 44229 / JCM 9112 / NBRC 15066 / NRRL 15764) TaxID=1179773 RepID=K0K0K7_SACES|nr:hypothetical protein [Saccharothrix espanaensis]CCH31891.1 hypothetical protein BN6_46120 [Saccharothrix espanaensis DSM 44229]
MSRFPMEATVQVRPYSSRREDDHAVIGDDQRQVYLSIPTEGLDLLEWLREGVPLAEAVRRYEERHGESPDAEEFLEELAGEGFVAPQDAELEQARDGRPKRAWNLDGLSPRAARRWFSAPVAVVAGLVVATAVVLAFLDPRALPGSSSLMFHDHFWAYLWGVIAIATIGVVVHELAHVVAARAAGVSARMTIGNQMYAIVAQTDMSGIWLAPKRARYLALLAGMIVDVLGAALLFIVVWLDRAGVLGLAAPVRTVLAGVLFTYFIRLLWQTFVFLRTDLYYVIATALDTRSLMADTGVYLRNLVRRVRRRPLIDQTGIERREMRAIRVFSVVWVLGRVLSLATLFGLTIPLLLFYGGRVVAFFSGEPVTGTFTWADLLAFALLTFLLDFGGIVLWVRSLIRSSRARRRAPDRVLVE